MKPWEEFANAMEESQRQVENERMADCVMREIASLLEHMAFKEVALIIRESNELLREAQDVAEEEAQARRAETHRRRA
jgi:hypothetical protein